MGLCLNAARAESSGRGQRATNTEVRKRQRVAQAKCRNFSCPDRRRREKTGMAGTNRLFGVKQGEALAVAGDDEGNYEPEGGGV